ncbi:MAG: hypothetical protein HY928_10965 [Elusimicrobia bacterium]|nr:hypothetical protein [Elusimicrobiota bacterium]
MRTTLNALLFLLVSAPASAAAGFIPTQANFSADWFSPPYIRADFLGDSLQVVRPAGPTTEPSRVVALGDVFNKNWKADSFQTPDGPVSLGTHFDLRGNAFLSVVMPHAMMATLYKYELGMTGSWQAGGETYDLTLEVSIFRSRTNNYVTVKKRSDGRTVYRKRIREVLLKTFPRGEKVMVRGREYRLFFSHGVLGGSPARPDPNTYAVVLVTNIGDDSDSDYRSYILPYRDLEDGALVTYQLYEGYRVRLRALKDTAELEIYIP